MKELSIYDIITFPENVLALMPPEVLDLHQEMVDYLDIYGDDLDNEGKEALHIISIWYDRKIVSNPLVNQTVTTHKPNIEVEIEEETEVEVEAATGNEDNALVNQLLMRYNLIGDRVEEKLDIINLMHEWVGFPVTYSAIANRYKLASGYTGINQFVKELITVSGTKYNESTVKNLVYTVISIDNSVDTLEIE